MDESLRKLIVSNTKDEQSAQQIIDAVQKIVDEKERKTKFLGLLEAAIRNDYDSILITELSLESPGPKIVYVNDGFTKMTGYTREEAIGQTPRILQGPKTDRATLDKLRKNLAEGKSFFGQTVNYRKDGSEFINQWDIHPLIDQDGKVTHWVSYQHDITERKRAEQNIFEGDVDINDVYESAKRTIVDVDRNGNIIFANKSFRELSGYTKEELSKHKLWELLPNKQQRALASQFSQIWENESDERKISVILRHKNGSPVQVEFQFKKMDLDSGTIMRADAKNLSLRKKVMENLRSSNEKFSKIFAPAKEFTYGLSFENDNVAMRYVSENLQHVLGYTEEELSEENGWLKIIHPEDQKMFKEHLSKATKGISSCELFRLVSKSGDEMMVMDYAKNDGDSDIKGTITETRLEEA